MSFPVVLVSDVSAPAVVVGEMSDGETGHDVWVGIAQLANE
jgi:hypothetical protein